MIEDRSAAFAHWAAERRAVAGARGDVVRLMRYHRPMAGRAYPGQLPPLRNKHDVRCFAREAGQAAAPRAVDAFVSAAVRLWGEFVETLAEHERADASALVDLDAPARREAARRALIMAWADAFGDRPATAAELREVWGVREAICSATRPGADPDEAISPTMVSRFVRDLAAAEVDGWRIMDAEPNRHEKVRRWALLRLSDDQGRAEPRL